MEGTITSAGKPGKNTDKDATAKPAADLPINHPDAPHITIHVQKGEGDDEKDGIFVGVNGTNDFMVPRGMDVSVPVAVYEILANAKRVQMSEDGGESFEHNRFSIQVKSPIAALGRG